MRSRPTRAGRRGRSGRSSAAPIRQLSDFEPKGATARAFGVLHDGGFAQRALVVVDPGGVVRWSYEAPSPGDLPGANLIYRPRFRSGSRRSYTASRTSFALGVPP